MKFEDFRVPPAAHGRFRLRDHLPGETLGMEKSGRHAANVEKLAALHDLLYAEHKRSLLIVLQGMDTSGKDGTIRHVMSGVNPQGCIVTSFKQPTAPELDHDYLWRIHAAVPPKGAIGIFNRSHYEDVLSPRVHRLIPKTVVRRRFAEINDFERMLTNNGVTILKFFLNISRDEQARRLDERLADPTKRWKASVFDFREREFWNEYQTAYEDAIAQCSTAEAPWYVIPADHKWFRNWAVSELVIRTLRAFRMSYPEAAPDLRSSKPV